MRFLVAAGIAVAVAIAGTSPVLAAGNVEAGKTKAAACMACHGPDGNSLVGAWPKLAGQLPLYIEKQLHDFKSGRRKNDQMSPMTQPLSDQDIEDLAAFFSSQQVSQGVSANQDRLRGRKLYLEGKGRPRWFPPAPVAMVPRAAERRTGLPP